MNEHIKKAVDLFGSQKLLADACGVSQPAVFKWLSGSRIKPENAAMVERVTAGKVTRRDLLPDFPWESQSAA
ncbi:MAG: Cro/CI family transcriptional regulator [Candidatus Sedimenticola sp. (ex Thyasira tokunagai)]